MTKYVLNSGAIGRNPELKKEFHREIITGLGSQPHVLVCCFAKARETWEEKLPGRCASIAEDMPAGTAPTFELAMPDQFVEQCAAADVIYMVGGDDFLVQYWLGKYDLEKTFADKVVATNSASSHAMVKHSWTCDWRKCIDGIGLLPIKFIAHYNSDYGIDDPRGPINWEAGYAELQEYGDTELPIHALEEGRYLVVST